VEYHLPLKALHLLGMVLFLGNIIVTAVWKALADRTRSPQVIAYAQRLVTLTDVVFTGAGAALVLVTGLWMAPAFGGVAGARWLSWGLVLFAASGLIWVLVLIPVQVKQARIARALGPESAVPERYWRLSRTWMIFGVLATVLPLLNLYVMVFKPT
jgi:uncharacterized membrane protein